jgi:hypothetical protein
MRAFFMSRSMFLLMNIPTTNYLKPPTLVGISQINTTQNPPQKHSRAYLLFVVIQLITKRYLFVFLSILLHKTTMSSHETDHATAPNSQVTLEEYETILMLTRKMEGGEPERVSSPEQELQDGMITTRVLISI